MQLNEAEKQKKSVAFSDMMDMINNQHGAAV